MAIYVVMCCEIALQGIIRDPSLIVSHGRMMATETVQVNRQGLTPFFVFLCVFLCKLCKLCCYCLYGARRLLETFEIGILSKSLVVEIRSIFCTPLDTSA